MLIGGKVGGGEVHINLKQGTFDANKACNDLLNEHGWFLGFRVQRQHGANEMQDIPRMGVLGEGNTNCSSSWLFHLKL
jgi:hypothetical protein